MIETPEQAMGWCMEHHASINFLNGIQVYIDAARVGVGHTLIQAVNNAIESMEHPNAQETQFAGFALALYGEMATNVIESEKRHNVDILKEEQIRLIARYAHKLVKHTLEHLPLYELETCESRDDLIPLIPDMEKTDGSAVT